MAGIRHVYGAAVAACVWWTLQECMIRMVREKNKLAITATPMKESMILAPTPKRAEVWGVANAVPDGTDAVTLSAETAAGRPREQTVESMARTCLDG